MQIEKKSVLLCIFILIELIYNHDQSKIGKNFRKDFINNFKDTYGNLERRDYLQAVAAIRNFRLRNKIIGLFDSMNHNLPPQIIENQYISKDKIISQFNWIISNTRIQMNIDLLAVYIEKCRQFIGKDQFQLLFQS